MNTQRAATRFLLFALIGLLMEVFFTAIADGVGGDIDLRGSTSPWMMIDYGILGIALLPLKAFLDKYGLPLPARAFVYMLGIFFELGFQVAQGPDVETEYYNFDALSFCNRYAQL